MPWSSQYTRVASLNSHPPLLMLMCRLVYSPSATVTSMTYIPPDWPDGPKDRPNPLGPRSHPVTHIVSLTYPAWKSNYLNKLLRQWKCRSSLYECSNSLFWQSDGQYDSYILDQSFIASFAFKKIDANILWTYCSVSKQNMFQSAQSWRSSKAGCSCICQSLPATAVPVCRRQDAAKPIWKQLQQPKVGGHQQQQLPGWGIKIRGDWRGTNRGRNHSKLCLPMYLLSLLSL